MKNFLIICLCICVTPGCALLGINEIFSYNVYKMKYEDIKVVKSYERLDAISTWIGNDKQNLRDYDFYNDINPDMLQLLIIFSSEFDILDWKKSNYSASVTFQFEAAENSFYAYDNSFHVETNAFALDGKKGRQSDIFLKFIKKDLRRYYYYTYVNAKNTGKHHISDIPEARQKIYDFRSRPQDFTFLIDFSGTFYHPIFSNVMTVPAADIARAFAEFDAQN